MVFCYDAIRIENAEQKSLDLIGKCAMLQILGTLFSL